MLYNREQQTSEKSRMSVHQKSVRALSRRPPKIWLPARHTHSSHDDCQSQGCSVGRLEFGGQNTSLPAFNVHPSKLIGYCYCTRERGKEGREEKKKTVAVCRCGEACYSLGSRAHFQRRRPLQVYNHIWRMQREHRADDLFNQPRTIDLGDSAEYGRSPAVSRREGGENISSEGEPSRRARPMKT